MKGHGREGIGCMLDGIGLSSRCCRNPKHCTLVCEFGVGDRDDGC